MNAFLLLVGWDDEKGMYKYLFSGFWKVEYCSVWQV